MRFLGGLAFLVGSLLLAACAAPERPLPSWNGGGSRDAIVSFVARVTTPGTPDFVPPAERIAVFDNDGTLWSEQPMYVQLAFTLDRLKALAERHPEWKDRPPFAAALAGDFEALSASGERGLMELVMATHADLTVDEFAAIVRDWLATARHPAYGRPYVACTYRPMVELLEYLRAHGFKTYIVSGGGVEFMRPWAEAAYGIPPEQVIGSAIRVAYEVRDGRPTLVRRPEVEFIDDRAGKPVGIHRFIGRRPILAAGNSDGDYEMLEYVTAADPAGGPPRLGLIVHHTDGEREVAYDRASHFGRLDRALTDAPERGWIVIDMRRDWREVFAPGK